LEDGELPVRRRRRFEQPRSRIRREFASNGELKSSRTPGATLRTPLCRELASSSEANSRRTPPCSISRDAGAGLAMRNHSATNRSHGRERRRPLPLTSQ